MKIPSLFPPAKEIRARGNEMKQTSEIVLCLPETTWKLQLAIAWCIEHMDSASMAYAKLKHLGSYTNSRVNQQIDGLYSNQLHIAFPTAPNNAI